jgi:hypothetical protein
MYIYVYIYMYICINIGVLSFNGWGFVDTYLAGIMHDCINVFQCAPTSRPDLPVYFFSRYIYTYMLLDIFINHVQNGYLFIRYKQNIHKHLKVFILQGLFKSNIRAVGP